MTKIIKLEIKNYKGIKELTLNFPKDQSLICFIGRGDTGKTSILEAISAVLSPNWNLNFYDTDFYNCDTTKTIEVLVSLIEFPRKLSSESKFGLYLRSFNIQNNEISDDIFSNEGNSLDVLTIKLTVEEMLEPQWVVTTSRSQEDKPISATDRSLLNCYMISDYVDKHFSWNKGNPLYALLKINGSEENLSNNVILKQLREVRNSIDKENFNGLKDATEKVIEQASKLGINIYNIGTTVDVKELVSKEARISLHEEEVPFRQKGKGSKRLTSLAIQSALVREGGIMLIDEIEQGLEPNRIKQAVRTLKEIPVGQVFITTHSRDAITELGVQPLILVKKNEKTSEIEVCALNKNIDDERLQKVLRACPEAFFAKKVIVCEGATEIGICRALDEWRQSQNKTSMSFNECAYVDGTGSVLKLRVEEIFPLIKTSLFCDSDNKTINEFKNNLENVKVFSCQDGYNTEQQIFQDLPSESLKEVFEYICKSLHKSCKESLKDSVRDFCKPQNQEILKFNEDWEAGNYKNIGYIIVSAITKKRNEKNENSSKKSKKRLKKIWDGLKLSIMGKL